MTLSHQDVANAIDRLGEEFAPVRNKSAQLWWEILHKTGKSSASLKLVVDRYLAHESRTPTVADINKRLSAVSEDRGEYDRSREEELAEIKSNLALGLRPITGPDGKREAPYWLHFDPDIKKSQCIGIAGSCRGQQRYMSKIVFTSEVVDYDEPGLYMSLFGARDDELSARLGRITSMNTKQLLDYHDELFERALLIFQEDPSAWQRRLNPVGWQIQHTWIKGVPDSYPEVLPPEHYEYEQDDLF